LPWLGQSMAKVVLSNNLGLFYKLARTPNFAFPYSHQLLYTTLPTSDLLRQVFVEVKPTISSLKLPNTH
jgi:hypothetical protein